MTVTISKTESSSKNMQGFYLQNMKEDQPNTQERRISAQVPFYKSL